MVKSSFVLYPIYLCCLALSWYVTGKRVFKPQVQTLAYWPPLTKAINAIQSPVPVIASREKQGYVT